jgi:hypothetical protein
MSATTGHDARRHHPAAAVGRLPRSLNALRALNEVTLVGQLVDVSATGFGAMGMV